MGLDMYLSKKLGIRNYNYDGAPKNEVTLRVDGVTVDTSDASEITFEVMYWRKANAIHAFFVDRCQGGRDECQPSYVSLDVLEELRDLCRDIITVHDNGGPWQQLAEETLPAQSGFFFGDTDYSEWYLSDLRTTLAGLETHFALDRSSRSLGIHYSYEYQASW
jgi:hypothetical protein